MAQLAKPLSLAMEPDTIRTEVFHECLHRGFPTHGIDEIFFSLSLNLQFLGKDLEEGDKDEMNICDVVSLLLECTAKEPRSGGTAHPNKGLECVTTEHSTRLSEAHTRRMVH